MYSPVDIADQWISVGELECSPVAATDCFLEPTDEHRSSISPLSASIVFETLRIVEVRRVTGLPLGILLLHKTGDNFCRIGDVEPGSPAAAAGLTKEDWVVTIDGTSIRRTAEFGDIVAQLNTPMSIVQLGIGRPYFRTESYRRDTISPSDYQGLSTSTSPIERLIEATIPEYPEYSIENSVSMIQCARIHSYGSVAMKQQPTESRQKKLTPSRTILSKMR